MTIQYEIRGESVGIGLKSDNFMNLMIPPYVLYTWQKIQLLFYNLKGNFWIIIAIVR